MLIGRKEMEKVFIGFFLLVLIVPFSGILMKEYNIEQIKLENRNINSRPDIHLIGKKEFYSGMEQWFGDRFLGRKYLIDYWNKAHYDLGLSISKYAVIGKNQWLFNKNILPSEMKNLDEKTTFIKSLQNYCQESNVDFLLLIPPNKEYIYPENYPNWLKTVDYKPFQDKVEKSLSSEKVNYLFLTGAILEAKRVRAEALYFKDDHHWNYYGSFEGTKAMLTKLKTDGVASELDFLTLDDTFKKAWKESSLAIELKIPFDSQTDAPWNKNFTDEIYELDENSGTSVKIGRVISNDYVWEKSIKGPVVIENKNIKNNTTILIIGDSYTGYMLPYITQTIGRVVFINWSKKAYKNGDIVLEQLINKYHPNAIIYEMLSDPFYKNGVFDGVIIK